MSDLMFCLLWETERPFLGKVRRSSCFRMLNGIYYLELSLERSHPNLDYYKCDVRLRREYTSMGKAETLSANCGVIADSLAFGGEIRVFPNIGDYLLECTVLKDKLRPSEKSSIWKIICRFSCTKISLRVDNETILLRTADDCKPPPKSVNQCIQVSQEVPLDTEDLSSDISSLLQDGIFSDFELKCGSRIFPVHRSVLAARSEVFRAMIRNKMLESESGSADISDLNVSVVESLLKFLYSGKLEDISEDTAAGLYEAADKYAVRSLRKACSYWMERNLSEGNCVRYLITADSHSDPDLKAGVAQFIVQHPGMFKSAEWVTFSDQHQNLAIKVFQAYFSSVSQ